MEYNTLPLRKQRFSRVTTHTGVAFLLLSTTTPNKNNTKRHIARIAATAGNSGLSSVKSRSTHSTQQRVKHARASAHIAHNQYAKRSKRTETLKHTHTEYKPYVYMMKYVMKNVCTRDERLAKCVCRVVRLCAVHCATYALARTRLMCVVCVCVVNKNRTIRCVVDQQLICRADAGALWSRWLCAAVA